MSSSQGYSRQLGRMFCSQQHVSSLVWYYLAWDVSRVFSGKSLLSRSRFSTAFVLIACTIVRNSAANWFKCGLETLLLGGACATVAYTIGQFVDKHIVQGEY